MQVKSKHIIFSLLLLLTLISCSPKTRFTRLVEKYPHLLTIDSVQVIDTVRLTVEKVEHDTVFSQHFWTEITRDTLIIEKDRLKIEIFHDTIHDSVYVSGKCDTITIEKIIERKIPVKYYEKTPKWKQLLNKAYYLFLILAILYGLYRLYKYLKPKLL
jgi:hypothetical protein